jgi:MFS family permease
MKRISRNVKFLGLVSLFNDFSSEMVYPLIPIFLTSVLNAPMAVIGIIEGIAESTSSLLKVFSGWYSDRLKKRLPFAITGYTLSAVSRPILAVAFGWPVVLLARFVDRLGKGVRTSARDALIADSTHEDHRGRAFGYHRALDTMGAIGGPLVAFIFLHFSGESFRTLFLLASIPAVIGVVLLILFVKETAVTGKKTDPVLAGRIFSGLGRPFSLFLVVTGIFAIGNSSDAFLILRAKDVGFSTTTVILIYVLYNCSYALLSYPAGILSDRIGRKGVMISGYLLFALVYTGIALTPNPSYFWLIFVVYGFYVALTEGVSKAMIADVVEPGRIATAMGAWQTLTGLATFFASFVAGLLWQYIGPTAPFVYGAGAAILASLLFAVLIRDRK